MEIKKTGYPHIDKPWLAHYDKALTDTEIPADTLYNFIRTKNADNMNAAAIDYFETKITYEQLFNQVEMAAVSFLRLGVSEGDIVSLCVLNTPEAFISVLALNKIGAVCSFIKPITDTKLLTEKINNTKSDVMIIADVYYNTLNLSAESCCIKKYIVCSLPNTARVLYKSYFYRKYSQKNLPIAFNENIIAWQDFISEKNNKGNATAVKFKEKTPAVIMYTGKITGMENGAVLTNEAFCTMYFYKTITEPKYKKGQSFLNILQPYTENGFTYGLFLPLAFGMCIISVPVFSVDEIPKLLKKHRPNHIAAMSSFFEYLQKSKLPGNNDLSYIQGMTTVDSYMCECSEHELNTLLRTHNSGAKIYKSYGMAELTSTAIYTVNDKINIPGSVGIPLLHNNVKIIDINTGEDLKYMQIGEICINGPTMMLEYFKVPKETQKTIKKHSDGKLWLHTEDVGYMTNYGVVFLVDRMKVNYVDLYSF